MAFAPTDQMRRRLDTDQVMWLTTISPKGRPSPRPVWFTWDGTELIVYSQPTAAKVRHIAANDRVAINFNSTEEGGDVVVLGGRARVVEDGRPPSADTAYREKYRAGLQELAMSAEDFDASYSTLVRIVPDSGWAIGD